MSGLHTPLSRFPSYIDELAGLLVEVPVTPNNIGFLSHSPFRFFVDEISVLVFDSYISHSLRFTTPP